MQFVGKVWKDGRTWLVEVPALDLMTQGTSRKNALEMVIDAVEALMEHQGFRAEVAEETEEQFFLTGNDTKALIALMLKRQREKSGLSLIEVAARLGSTSPNTYGAYEQGNRSPSTEKLDELLSALGSKSARVRFG